MRYNDIYSYTTGYKIDVLLPCIEYPMTLPNAQQGRTERLMMIGEKAAW